MELGSGEGDLRRRKELIRICYSVFGVKDLILKAFGIL